MTPREAAFKALTSHQFASEALGDWQRRSNPDPRDFRLAQEIAYGTTRMARALDAAAKQLTPTGKLQLKRKEKALLRTALYQALYMERIPLYAIAEESVAL
ncbi:MAG: hypothetical protein KDK48_06175, partial [Chlamydiia bacterium]|nr:hypothetical protein [Chlamydiia bacterium]